MSFQPVIPMGGLGGWSFLSRTRESQAEAFENSPVIRRDTAYFEDRITKVETAEQLVSDRRLLRVALGAFGLEDDINSRFFIRKVLEGGTTGEDALATKLSDSRYREFSKAFGFGDVLGRRTGSPGFGAEITTQFRARQFEVAVGNQDENLRLAMSAERSLPNIVSGESSDNTKWLKIMGNPPLRKVAEVALGLPASVAQIDLDKQIELFSERARTQLGVDSPDQLAEPEHLKNLIRRFLLREQVSGIEAQSGGSVALSLLQSIPRLTR